LAAQTAPAPERLRRPTDINTTLRHGTRVRGRLVTVAVLERGDDAPPRLAVIASRRVGTATRRNRAKRLLREAGRQLPWGPGVDVVLVAHPGLVSARLGDVLGDLRAAAPDTGV
jgi:ribonuclease P protein component